MGRKRETKLAKRLSAYQNDLVGKPHKCNNGNCAVTQNFLFVMPGSGKKS